MATNCQQIRLPENPSVTQTSDFFFSSYLTTATELLGPEFQLGRPPPIRSLIWEVLTARQQRREKAGNADPDYEEREREREREQIILDRSRGKAGL